jgi:hypothetical protein
VDEHKNTTRGSQVLGMSLFYSRFHAGVFAVRQSIHMAFFSIIQPSAVAVVDDDDDGAGLFA